MHSQESNRETTYCRPTKHIATFHTFLLTPHLNLAATSSRSMPFWCGSGSVSADPYLRLIDLDSDLDLDLDPDPDIFVIDLQDDDKN
jgi:hypothetical protein